MPIRSHLKSHLFKFTKGIKHFLAFPDMQVTFTVPVNNFTCHIYGISEGTKHLLAFPDILYLLYL